jgi:hypothetical protein
MKVVNDFSRTTQQKVTLMNAHKNGTGVAEVKISKHPIVDVDQEYNIH